MNESDDGIGRPDQAADTGSAREAGDEESVGSVGDEAAKLLGALSDWARDQGADYAETAASTAGSFASAVRNVGEHVATGSQDCRYCPVCQVVHIVRQTSPEVRDHLSSAASSLMHAAAGLLSTSTPAPQRAGSPVERIDLDNDANWEERR